MRSGTVKRGFAKSLLQAPIITFIAGTVLGTAAQYFVQDALTRNITYLLAFISIYIFYSIFTAGSLSRDTYSIVSDNHYKTIETMKSIQTDIFDAVSKLHEDILGKVQQLGLNIRWIPNQYLDKDPGYELSLQIVKNAQKSIYILSDYSPQDQEQKFSPKREEYLRTIANVVSKKAASGGKFEYKRIMQIPTIPGTFNGVLGLNDLPGDQQTFAHCKEIIHIKREIGGRIDVHLYLSRFIPSAPSILLVDQQHILFTLPGKRGMLLGDDTPYIQTVGVLHIEDNTANHELAEDFMSMFDSYLNKADSREITNITG